MSTDATNIDARCVIAGNLTGLSMRTGSGTPSLYRLGRKRDGTLVLQGGFEWRDVVNHCITDAAYEWRDIETVELP